MNVDHKVERSWRVFYTSEEFPIVHRGGRKHPLQPSQVEICLYLNDWLGQATVRCSMVVISGRLTKSRLGTGGLLPQRHEKRFYGGSQMIPAWVNLLIDSATANTQEAVQRSPEWVSPRPDRLAQAFLKAAREEHDRNGLRAQHP